MVGMPFIGGLQGRFMFPAQHSFNHVWKPLVLNGLKILSPQKQSFSLPVNQLDENFLP